MKKSLTAIVMALSTIAFASLAQAASSVGTVEDIKKSSREIIVNGKRHYVHKHAGPIAFEDLERGDRVRIRFDNKSTRAPVTFINEAN